MSDRFRTYEEALDHLLRSTDYERMQHLRYNSDTFNLERITELLDALGRPERRFRSIHIAGTKGKGSTAAMAEAIVRRHGLHTGLFTSPHLVDMRERIQLDRQLIDRELLRQVVGRVADAVEARCRQQPTYFEYLTAAAFLAFAERRVDLAVIEVGLGGRLDSTNVIVPAVGVITGISIDHSYQLGPDLASIGREKAGIAKPGVPLVVAPQDPEAEAVIREATAAVGAPLVQVGRDVTFTWEKCFVAGRPASRVTIAGRRGTYEKLEMPLAGRFQATNAACAVAAAEIALGDRLDPAAVRAALAAVDWPGRMQTFPGEVTVVLDGAHNARSMAELLIAVEDYFPNQRTVYVFASAADKDIPGMLDVLARAGAEVIFTRTDNPRAANPDDLARDYQAACARQQPLGEAPLGASLAAHAAAATGGRGAALGSSSEIERALALARNGLGNHGVIVACGSLYLVGALLQRQSRIGL